MHKKDTQLTASRHDAKKNDKLGYKYTKNTFADIDRKRYSDCLKKKMIKDIVKLSARNVKGDDHDIDFDIRMTRTISCLY